jgi:hypothetical protein
MKLSELNKRLKGLKTDIGVIRIGDRVVAPVCSGTVKKIEFELNAIVIDWDDGCLGYRYSKGSVERNFKLVK